MMLWDRAYSEGPHQYMQLQGLRYPIYNVIRDNRKHVNLSAEKALVRLCSFAVRCGSLFVTHVSKGIIHIVLGGMWGWRDER